MYSDTKSKAFLATYKRGYAAGRAGKPKTANPSPDRRTFHGSVTFSRAFIRYWNEGMGGCCAGTSLSGQKD